MNRQGAAALSLTPPNQLTTFPRSQGVTPSSRPPSSKASSLGAGAGRTSETAKTGEPAETHGPSATEKNRGGNNSRSEAGGRETRPSSTTGSSRNQGYQVNDGARQPGGSGGGRSSGIACREAARLSGP